MYRKYIFIYEIFEKRKVQNVSRLFLCRRFYSLAIQTGKPMASNVFGAKTFKATAPEKGSFPLDHDGECKEFFLKYMICLKRNGSSNAECRPQSKDYLDCRMRNNLMAKEDWSKLGFADLAEKDVGKKS